MPAMRLAFLLLCLVSAMPARAWSPQGHQTIGAIADTLVAGTRAAREVHALLGDESLGTAALWADCVKGVSEREPYRYVANPRYAECQPFHGEAGEREMEDYVRRNLEACRPLRGQENCHKQYHYTDVAVQRAAYARGLVGTSDHDIVAAIQACVRVLRGEPAPAPFDLRSRKEALRLLAHLVGDVHQPLHVGVVYLDAAGGLADPDAHGYRADTDTHGGNAMQDANGQNWHSEWDALPGRLQADRFAGAGAGLAKAVGRTRGDVLGWPQAWASETLVLSAQVHARLSYGARREDEKSRGNWPILGKTAQGPADASLKESQVVKAGARLAQLLEAIWP